VIAFGVCVGPSDRFRRIAGPSLEQWGGPDATVIVRQGQTSICQAYNSILDEVCDRPDLEAVVLLHDDVELCQPVDEVLQRAFEDPDVAVFGAIGGAGDAQAMPWWSRPRKYGSVRRPGDPAAESFGWHDVDVIDGLLIALSPWASRHLRFDADAFPGFHGYDADICSAARAARRRIVVGPIDVIHHANVGPTGYGSRASYLSWVRANLAWRTKWDSPSPATRLLLTSRRTFLPLEARVRPTTRRRLAEFKAPGANSSAFGGSDR
jgi:hypothetical protein